tara:strand:- start:1905 stop:2207 length:303 start_codon:yes stop_codon:yes gene_type:complete
MMQLMPGRVQAGRGSSAYDRPVPGAAAPEQEAWWQKYLVAPAMQLGMGAASSAIHGAMPTQVAERAANESTVGLNRALSSAAQSDPNAWKKILALQRRGF